VTTEKIETVDKPKNTGTIQPVVTPQKPEIDHTKPLDSTLNDKVIEGNTYFSVQIGANITPVEPVAANFKGLKEIRREKTDKYYRYYVGKETSMTNITPIWQQVKLKFPQAFIVSFVDGKRIIIDSSIHP
jgi:hypothetical protein